MMRDFQDKSSEAFQRLSWDALRNSINSLGRGLFCRSCIKSQLVSPAFTDVLAALVSLVNTKFPQVGKLLLTRIVLQLKRACKRNDMRQLLAATNVEVAVGFVKECGALLQDITSLCLRGVFERFRGILHEGEISKRVQFLIEGLFAIRKAKFQGSQLFVTNLILLSKNIRSLMRSLLMITWILRPTLMELCIMLLECCSQERTYLPYYGLLGQRLCMINKVHQENFEKCFVQQYSMIHRLETNKLLNVAKFFSHLFGTDALPWHVLAYIRLTEEDTTLSSRIFIKILFQELSKQLGLWLLKKRLEDPTMEDSFESIFPKDDPNSTQFAINFYTSIGLGGLTERLRDNLKSLPQQVPATAPLESWGQFGLMLVGLTTNLIKSWNQSVSVQKLTVAERGISLFWFISSSFWGL
ncbi:Pre-mRNA-splicing factor CWC22-like protein [Rhynchospora pubera]|uniref:Pre-mRNA-splicing factor CWC22-like protein n=1 Tax=Rhynchospora pubera TaxID=906938 RepID=A0AAV8GIC6_9POAL|nr:Pre-mRNA-splicing factor CWC22-like protein [Rhynchospora pubera]